METQSPRPSIVKVVLWAGLCLVMWFFAVVGSFFVLLAVVSLFVDLSPVVNMNLFGNEPVRTTGQKIEFLAVGAVLAAVGIGFLWLHRRGYWKTPL